MKTGTIISASLLTATLLTAGDQTGPQEKAKVVGRWNAPGSVLVNGAPSSSRGVTWSPVTAGDEVEAKEASALFRMVDKNRLTLGREAVAKVNQVGNKHSYLYLRQGEVRFEPVVGKLFICAIGHLFTPAAGSKGFVLVNADHTIRAEDTLKSLSTSGNRSCDETGAGLWLPGGAGAGASAGGVGSGIGVAAKTAISTGVAAGSGYAAWRIREGNDGNDDRPILSNVPPVSASQR